MEEVREEYGGRMGSNGIWRGIQRLGEREREKKGRRERAKETKSSSEGEG